MEKYFLLDVLLDENYEILIIKMILKVNLIKNLCKGILIILNYLMSNLI